MTDLNLYYSYNNIVDCAYIITVKNNEKSELLSKRCQLSCQRVNMPYYIWDAYDGTGNEIITPDHMKND